MQTRIDIIGDITKIEETMKEMVVQQLGDKYGYDSSLNDLERYVDANVKLEATETEPLENLIRSALNYDSQVYKEALGIANLSFGEPNGVLKSQEMQKKMRESKQTN